jgi:hypothetical protein
MQIFGFKLNFMGIRVLGILFLISLARVLIDEEVLFRSCTSCALNDECTKLASIQLIARKYKKFAGFGSLNRIL